jgi:hypothetical protein
MAQVAQEKGLFERAKYYFGQVLQLDFNDYASHWGLLQSELKCKNDDEIINQNTPVDSDKELFDNAINAAAHYNYTDVFNSYMDVKQRQIEAIIQRAAQKEARR